MTNDFNIDDVADDVLVKASRIQKYLGVSCDYWHSLLVRGKAPKPIVISSHVHRWRAGDIKKLKKEFYATGVLPVRRYHKPLDLSNKDIPDTYLASRRECALYLGISIQTWTKLVNTKQAPQPAKSMYTYPRWRVGDIRKFFKEGGKDA